MRPYELMYLMPPTADEERLTAVSVFPRRNSPQPCRSDASAEAGARAAARSAAARPTSTFTRDARWKRARRSSGTGPVGSARTAAFNSARIAALSFPRYRLVGIGFPNDMAMPRPVSGRNNGQKRGRSRCHGQASNAPAIKNGRMKVSTLPGLGLDLNMDYLKSVLAPGEPWWG